MASMHEVSPDEWSWIVAAADTTDAVNELGVSGS